MGSSPPGLLTKLCGLLAIVVTACQLSHELPATTRAPEVTAIGAGVAPDAVVVAGATEIFVGETTLGAGQASVQSRVRSLPISGGALQSHPETEHAGEISGLALATDGTIYLSRRASPRLSDSTLSAYRNGRETVLISGSDTAPADKSLRSPAGLALVKSGELIVADSVGSQILRVSLSGEVARFAGTGPCGSTAPPQPGPALATPLCGPELLAVDAEDTTYVARKGSRWIARIDQSGTLSLVATDVDVAGLATDSARNLLVSDGTRGEIIRYRGNQSSILVTGLDRPSSISVGLDGAIYVVSNGTRQVLRILIH